MRADVDTLIGSLPADTFTIISFATTTVTELPPTSDRAQALRVLDAITVEDPADAGGSSLELPLPEVRAAIASLRDGDPERRVVLVLASDGENTARTEPGTPRDGLTYAAIEPEIDDGAVLGYGTRAGASMPLRKAGKLTGGFVPDSATGRPAVSRLDGRHLQSVADDLGVPYVHRDQTNGISTIVAQLSAVSSEAGGATSTAGGTTGGRELTWMFALALSVLVGGEIRSGWRGMLASFRERRMKP